MKTNITTKICTFLGLFIIYIAVIMIVTQTSSNDSYKNINKIHNVSAELNFFQDTGNITPYEEDSSLWSSVNYPLQTIYESVKVTFENNPTPAPNAITTSNITRRSH